MNKTVWRKSSHSGGSGGDCVELAELGSAVGIRDSKNTAGGHLAVSRVALTELVERIKSNQI